MGLLKQLTASNDAGLYMMAGCMALGGLLALSLPKALVNR